MEEKVEVGDTPTEVQVAQSSDQTDASDVDTKPSVEQVTKGNKPKPANFLASIKQGKKLKTKPSVEKVVQQQGAQPKKASFLASIKQGKKPSQIKPNKVHLTPPTPPPQAIGKMSMEDALQTKLAAINAIKHGTPTPTPTPADWA